MWIALASALFGLILTGGAIVTGFYALSQQLDARAAQELKGKRDLLLHVLSEMPSPEAIAQNQHRFGDLLIGHDDLHLALSDPTTGQPVMNFSSTAQQSVVALDVKAPTDSHICSWSSASGAQFIAARGTGWVANGKAVRYYLSLDRLHDSKLLSGFIRTTLIALPVLLLLVGLGAWLIARTSFHPCAGSIDWPPPWAPSRSASGCHRLGCPQNSMSLPKRSTACWGESMTATNGCRRSLANWPMKCARLWPR
jgi:two-component system heavy metal sensor histidine kinase CusS